MLNAVNGAGNVYAVPQVEPVQARGYNVAMRGASDFERTPDMDVYEPKKKKKHTGLKVAGALVGAAAIASAVVAFLKGNKAGAEGFFKKLGLGYKQMWNGSKNWVVNKLNGILKEKISGAKTKEQLEKLAKHVKKYGTEETQSALAEALKKFESAAAAVAGA